MSTLRIDISILKDSTTADLARLSLAKQALDEYYGGDVAGRWEILENYYIFIHDGDNAIIMHIPK